MEFKKEVVENNTTEEKKETANENADQINPHEGDIVSKLIFVTVIFETISLQLKYVDDDREDREIFGIYYIFNQLRLNKGYILVLSYHFRFC